MSSKRIRLDERLVAQGLADSRSQAQRMIRAGQVQVAGQTVDSPGTSVAPEDPVALARQPRFVSRGGEKLEAALMRFGVAVHGLVAADVGASTGGFTDCLLQHGAARVYAIDVGYGQLAWRLRNDRRVTVLERTNARHLEGLPEPIDLVTVDVSFISLRLILPAAVGWLQPKGQVIALIKPQFEAGRRQVARGGVVRDPTVHQRVLEQVIETAASLGLGLWGLMRSGLLGPAGNREFLAWWKRGPAGIPNVAAAVAGCLQEP